MENSKTKVITGKVRFSYANIWEAKSINGGDEKYSVSLIIPKSDTKTVNEIKAAIEAAKQEGKAKFGGKIPANLKLPLRDGDIDRPDDEAYKNSYFINANSKDKPQVVDKNVKPILDQEEVYSGCYGRASINFYTFNQNGNKGIACGLGNLQKLSDGEPLSGRSRAEDDFTSAEDDDFLA
ncbi:DUF2815 family protein [Clostridium cellulovorans]|uniref:Phage-associated protein n=1 Tax=Clostridium cellulovorans (strain ATCC 35296 / DSM 3052 / OCM 3 / 743B) TaxID=573061 RepID=D9SSD3_CLOC7|nr:DUF2815 family protein [Clostridium cellulovorans]ADL50530.1 hypothetical protein Clocel_0760 [Clostridium cellulovorans 743B]